MAKDLQKEIEALKRGTQAPKKSPARESVKLQKTPYGRKGNPKAKSGAAYIPKGVPPAYRGGGREPGGAALERRTRRQLIEAHFGEDVELDIIDEKTGKKVRIKKPRIVVQMERLYLAGRTKEGYNADAIDKWLNRALGRAPQPLIGDEEEDPIQVDLGMDRILKKAYGNRKG